jgi:hypothetical protein
VSDKKPIHNDAVLNGVLQAMPNGADSATLRDLFALAVIEGGLAARLEAREVWELADMMLEARSGATEERERLMRLAAIGELTVADWTNRDSDDGPLVTAIASYVRDYKSTDTEPSPPPVSENLDSGTLSSVEPQPAPMRMVGAERGAGEESGP